MEYGGAEGGNWNGLPPEVLGMIFQHLPVADLLSCSVVSQNWKKAARDVLKRNRECYAYIKYFNQDIQGLNEMIASTDIMEMINGLHIRNEVRPEEEPERETQFWENCIRCSTISRILQSKTALRKLEEEKQKILGVLCGQWRYLDFDMGCERGHVVSLDKGLLLREISLATSDSLQKLVLGQGRDCNFIPCCETSFPKLKVIQVQQEHDLEYCLYRSLSNSAPNLEKITGATIGLDVNFPMDSFLLERMKSIWVIQDLVVPEGEAREVFRLVSGLSRLDLQEYHCEVDEEDEEEQNLPSWHSFVFPFLLRSLNTLTELDMYTLELYNLSMTCDGLKFPHLQRLSLATHVGVSTANEISALRNLFLPKLCPNLKQLELVEAHCRHDVEEVIIPLAEQGDLGQSHFPVAVDFICRNGLYTHEHLEFLLTIYPKLNKVRILELRNVIDSEISKIFWDAHSLEYLEINVLPPSNDVEFGIEALMCGINVEEAHLHWLEYWEEEDQLSSCIVPIRPSLLNAKNLKELKITEDIENIEGVPVLARCIWFTQVTENLPERRVRNLILTFDGSKELHDRLHRMRSFTWFRPNIISYTYLESSP